MPTCRWRTLDAPGWEHLDLALGADAISASGVLIGSRGGTDYGATYRMTLDPDWTVRHVEILRTDGARLVMSSGPEGWVVDGEGRPDLTGCVDVDLSGSPFTNTLPIRRMDLPVGEEITLRMAWIPLDTLRPFPDLQRYTRMEDGRIRYRNEDGSFERLVEVDEDGLVTEYPGLFARM